MTQNAVLIERRNDPARRVQLLLVPRTDARDAHFWWRVTDGGKGGLNRWTGPTTSTDQGFPLVTDGSEAGVVSVQVTDVDRNQIRAGFPHVLFQKARKAMAKTPSISLDRSESIALWYQLAGGEDMSGLGPQAKPTTAPTTTAPTTTAPAEPVNRMATPRISASMLEAARAVMTGQGPADLRQFMGLVEQATEEATVVASPLDQELHELLVQHEAEEKIKEKALAQLREGLDNPRMVAVIDDEVTVPTGREDDEEEPAEEPAEEEEIIEASPGVAYINRLLPGDVEDFKLLDYARERQHNVLLYGPTQSGKTTLPMAYAKSRKLRCVTISGDAAMDPNELFGHRTIQDGNDGYVENHVTQVIREGGVLIIDEINMFSQKILSPLFSLLDSRREIRIRDKGGEVVKAHPQLLVVATMNPRYAGTMAMSEALLDRFQHRHEWGYDPAIEKALVPSASLRELFTKARARVEIDTPMSTSLMMKFAEDVVGLGFTYARANMANRAMDSEERETIRQLLDTYESRIIKELLPQPEEEKAAKEQVTRHDQAKTMADWLDAVEAYGSAPWDF